MDETNPDWAPSLRLGYESQPTNLAEGRHQRRSRRAQNVPHCATAGCKKILQPSNSVQQSSKTCSGKEGSSDVCVGDSATAPVDALVACTAEAAKPVESSAGLAAGINKAQPSCNSESKSFEACSEENGDEGVEDAATAPAETPAAEVGVADPAESLPVPTSNALTAAAAAPDMPAMKAVAPSLSSTTDASVNTIPCKQYST
ncbi:hypothetical protein HPB50_011985 [Hyalomma asiaticum]|nr:hypothetical protein HPB50_011985 [Hyalomma asiaticum]